MVSKNNTFVCPACGRKTTEYTHGINKTLVSCLRALHNAGGSARLDALGLDNSQFTNFQKLRYFGLAVSIGAYSEWQITRAGVSFLQGRLAIPRFIITRNSRPVCKSDALVFIGEVKDCIQYKIQWQEQARQPNLFDTGEFNENSD
jgi:hypothetical protein